MALFCVVTMFNYLRKEYLRTAVQLLLIVAFTIKVCDLLISHYYDVNKAAFIENLADEDSSKDVNEDSFEKIDKKLYSGLESGLPLLSSTCGKYLPAPKCKYRFSYFKEPWRIILTPPPNVLF